MSGLLSNFPGLLIDFDGTLANTEPLHERALNAFFAQKGVIFGKKERGKSTLRVFRDWGEAQGRSAEAKAYLQEYLRFLPEFFTANLEHVHWQPDALSLLQSTNSEARVLVTGSFLEWLTVLDRKLFIFDFFPQLVTKEDLLPEREKPDPLAYLLAAEKLGLTPAECLAVEDSASGLRSAKTAGCYTVVIRRETETPPEFELADRVITSLEELLEG